MKKMVIILFTFLTSIHIFATVRTVNNAVANPGQYSTIEAAIIASSPGDTIYIHASAINYTVPAISKNNLTFIGAGHNPQKQNPYTTYVVGGFPVGQGNKLIGLRLEGINGANGNGGNLTGISIQRCVLHGSYAGVIFGSFISIGTLSDVLVEESILFGNGAQMFWAENPDRVFTNLTMRNNIFYFTGTSSVFDNMSNASTGILFDHNIFISTGATQPVFKAGFQGGASGISFTNNIFQNTNATTSSIVFGYFNNFSTLQNLNVNGGTGNLQGASPQFVNYPGGPFAYSHNYNLAAGSPCIGTGSGGSDMGIYAGASPFHWEGVASIPEIILMNVSGTQIPQGGAIHISFQSLIKN